MTSIEAVTGWLSISSLSWSVFRVALVWLAFYGTGSLIKRARLPRDDFRLMPPVIFGMLVYLVVVVLLSVLHLLTRTVLSALVAAGSVAGFVFLCIHCRKLIGGSVFRMKHPLIILPVLVAGYIMLTNLMLAGRPEINFNDTQVTYLVQPDRWLNEGRMYFLDETIFSAYPMTSEMLLLLPCSLSADRLDQMILGQVFSLSMIFALVLAAMSLMRFRWQWYPAAMISITGCSTILLWCHFAKPDATALFFITIALIILFKQIIDKESCYDLSSFIVMGLALTSKITLYVALIPFMIMYIYIIISNKHDKYYTITSTVLLFTLPLIFMIRTLIHTGTFLYPHPPFNFLLKPEWLMPDADITYLAFNDKSSDFFPHIGFIQNIWHYFGTWNSSLFLLIGGFILTFKRKYLSRRIMILAGIGIYATIALILFYPAWWGAKYGIMLIPFAAVFGLYMFSHVKYGLFSATALTVIIYFIYDTSFSPTEHYGLNFRNGLIESYISEDWKLPGTEILENQPELRITLWMNSHLPNNSTILSFYLTKRYFSNHRWINAWQYPVAAHLYLNNDIEDEIEILEELSIDYVIITESNPAPLDDENSVELFSRIGRGDVLEPVANIDGYTIYEFCPSNL